MGLKPTFLDYESMYSDEYSLRKMSVAEYLLDPRFECCGCAIKEGLDGKTLWLDGPDLPAYFAGLDPEKSWFVSHNALFDACITAWHFGVVPKLTTCTLSVSRAIIQHELRSLSLSSVAKHLGLGVKGDALLKVKGMNLAMIKAAGLYQDYVDYALQDVELCAEIFKRLVWHGDFPVEELAVMDMVIRATTQPSFVLDADILAEHHAEVIAKKEHMLAQAQTLGADGKSCLTGDESFAQLLRNLGVEPPKKISLKTSKERYAFAKTDVEFLDLLEHDNPSVQVLVAARMGHKTTIEETRSARFLKLSQLTWPGNMGAGLMPMPLRYSGAHTHRLSGDWSLNVQNLTRGGKLRQALKAPPGYTVVTVDASQIEARLNAWVCRQEDLIEQFANKEDVYSNFASEVFGYPVNKNEHPTQRFVGKQAILGLGFGLGWVKFQDRLKADSKNQTGTMIVLDDEEAMRVVNTYRSKYGKVPAMWRHLNNNVIPTLAYGGHMEIGPCIIEKNYIRLPGVNGAEKGLSLFYHNLRQEDGEWWFDYGGMRKKLYGGKLLENIVQSLDRVIVMGAALRIQKRIAPYRLVQQAHDENGYIVREQHAEPVKQIILEEMTVRPHWASDLPLAAEAGVGLSYGDAK